MDSKILFPTLIIFGFLATSILAIKFPWDKDSTENTSHDKHSLFPFHHNKNISKFSHNKYHNHSSKPSGSHPTKDHGGLDVDFYHIFTSFVNKTRETVPEIAHHGNFSMIQLGLLCAIGAMAAGVSLVAAEGFAFRKHETEVEHYQYLKSLHQHQHSASHGHPSTSYGSPSSTYGSPSSSYGTPSHSRQYNDRKRRSNRSKREADEDSAELPSYHEIVKPYSSASRGTNVNPQFQPNSNLQFQQNLQFQPNSNPQYPVYSLMYNSPLMANTAYQLAQLQQNYPFPENNPHHRRHGVDKIRRKYQELSSDAEFSRGLPLQTHISDFRKEGRKKKNRLRSELDLPGDVIRRRYRSKNNDFRSLKAHNS